MSVSFEGFDEKVLTFNTSEDLESGTLVKLSGNGTVTACGEDDGFIGVVIDKRKNICSVQVGGFVTLPYEGAAPGLNYQTLCAASEGAVTAGESGRQYLVTAVDSEAGTVGIIL